MHVDALDDGGPYGGVEWCYCLPSTHDEFIICMWHSRVDLRPSKCAFRFLTVIEPRLRILWNIFIFGALVMDTTQLNQFRAMSAKHSVVSVCRVHSGVCASLLHTYLASVFDCVFRPIHGNTFNSSQLKYKCRALWNRQKQAHNTLLFN